MNYEVNKKRIYVSLGFIPMIALCLYLFLSSSHSIQVDNKNSIVNYSEKLSTFPIGTTAKIEYVAKQKSYVEKISITESNAVIHINKAVLQTEDIYSIYFVTQIPKRGYLDIEMRINKKTGGLIAQISGAKQENKVSLNIGKRSYYTDIPTDWSERLTLTPKNIPSLAGNDICLTITNLNEQQQPSTICHHVTNTAERQGA